MDKNKIVSPVSKRFAETDYAAFLRAFKKTMESRGCYASFSVLKNHHFARSYLNDFETLIAQESITHPGTYTISCYKLCDRDPTVVYTLTKATWKNEINDIINRVCLLAVG